MKIRKFIQNVADILDMGKFSNHSKKKSLKELIDKLSKRKKRLEKKIENQSDKKIKKRLKEELLIAKFQIKMSKKHLDNLS